VVREEFFYTRAKRPDAWPHAMFETVTQSHVRMAMLRASRRFEGHAEDTRDASFNLDLDAAAGASALFFAFGARDHLRRIDGDIEYYDDGAGRLAPERHRRGQ